MTSLHHRARVAPSATALPRLLTESGRPRGLEEHLHLHGQLPDELATHGLIATLDAAQLLGRGGAGFPTARKWSAVAAAAGPKVVVANGSEGEPASHKDRTLLHINPHLVLDGLQLAAEAVDADQLYLYAPPGAALKTALEALLIERAANAVDRRPVVVFSAVDRYVAGEESAVAAALSGEPALPRAKPPRVFERGVRGRPTLVQNVETLAHVALIARYGADWYAGAGLPDEPGSLLITVGGAVHRPGVTEVAIGAALDDAVLAAGGPTDGVQAMLVGGYHGSWLRSGQVAATTLSQVSMSARGARVGTGGLLVLPNHACGLIEAASVARYLADQSAGQCGPCVFGLADIATAMEALTRRGDIRAQVAALHRWMAMVEGRGACSHPDGAVRFVRSTLEEFAEEVRLHDVGRCRSGGRTHDVLSAPRNLGTSNRKARL
jgi:NADH:ubiquinone oxidoreductase subunit F (NADH-binding)